MDALIFDFDGLLVDTEWPAFVTVQAVFRNHGVEITLDEWRQRIGRGDNRPWTEMLEARVGRVDRAGIDEVRRRRKDDLTDAEPLLPGVVELLDAADRRGLALAVASSSSSRWVHPHLRRRGIFERFGAVVTRDQVVRAKPWPDLFLAACAAVSVTPDRAVAFEDSVHGVAAAKAAGLFCVAVPNRVTAGDDFGAADLVVASLLDIDLALLPSAGPGGEVAGRGS